MIGSDGWNNAKPYVGWIPGMNNMGGAIDKAFNPEAYTGNQSHGMYSSQLNQQNGQYAQPKPQQSDGWKTLAGIGQGMTSFMPMLAASGVGLPIALGLGAAGAGLSAYSNYGYADGGSVEDEQHYDEGGSVYSEQGLGSFSPQNDYATRPSFYDPNQMNNAFSGMTPMYATSPNSQQNQQFARGGVATNFGRTRRVY